MTTTLAATTSWKTSNAPTRTAAGWTRPPVAPLKLISQLLETLPKDHTYHVIFMRRHLDEVLASQKKMLENRGEAEQLSDPEGDLRIKEKFVEHLAEIETLLRDADHFHPVCKLRPAGRRARGHRRACR